MSELWSTTGLSPYLSRVKLLNHLRATEEKVIIYDKGCLFTQQYFNETTDFLLNPFDARCAHWDLWAEASNDNLLHSMALALFPISEDHNLLAKTAGAVFAAEASALRHEPKKRLDKLLDLLIRGSVEHLEPHLLESKTSADSLRYMFKTFLKPLESFLGLESLEKPMFSIRDYISNEQHTGWLFLSSLRVHHKILHPLLSMWMKIASSSLSEHIGKRVWLIGEEPPDLQGLTFKKSPPPAPTIITSGFVPRF